MRAPAADVHPVPTTTSDREFSTMLNPVAQAGSFTDLDAFAFESWGYLVIPDVLTADEAAEAYDASERLHAGRAHEFGQIGRGYETEPSLEALIDHPAVLPKARGLLGDRFVLQASWNTMQPAYAGVGGWHQDGSSAYDFKQVGYPVPLLHAARVVPAHRSDRARDGQHGAGPGQPPQPGSAAVRRPQRQGRCADSAM